MTPMRLSKIEHDLKGAIRTQQLIMEEAIDTVKQAKTVDSFLMASMENALKKCSDSWNDLVSVSGIGNQYVFAQYEGADVRAYISEVANFRIKYFKCFPYLYKGSPEYERQYLEGFSKDGQALLVLVRYNDRIIGISTAAPLVSDMDILREVEEKFERAGYRPDDFFYYGEIIVKEDYKRKGICREVFERQELYARQHGFKHFCLATVIRSENDPLRPDTYQNADIVWRKMGFSRSDIVFDYEWPTIQPDGKVKNVQNKMVFWIKA